MVVNISAECLAPQAPKAQLVLGDVTDFLREALEEVGPRREPPRPPGARRWPKRSRSGS